jgi:hypothetical protein
MVKIFSQDVEIKYLEVRKTDLCTKLKEIFYLILHFEL